MVVAESLKSYLQEGSKRLLQELKEAGVNMAYLGGRRWMRPYQE